jgi:hypothetical protein
MEFVIVTFPTARPVRMDGAQQGQTGQIIGVQRGTHIFDLGRPQDYAPPTVQTVVANTTQMQPLVIPFQPAVLPVAAAPAAAAEAGPEAAAPMHVSSRRAIRKKLGARKKTAAPKTKSSAKRKSTRKRADRGTRSATRRKQPQKASGGRKRR